MKHSEVRERRTKCVLRDADVGECCCPKYSVHGIMQWGVGLDEEIPCLAIGG